VANLHCECQELEPKGNTDSSFLVLHPPSGVDTVKTVGSHLKRTKPTHYVASEPAKKAKHCLFEKDFKLPIYSTRERKSACRRKLIRETVTCLETYVDDQPITSSHFEELAKKLCEKVPLLRDERPPLWCDVLEFH